MIDSFAQRIRAKDMPGEGLLFSPRRRRLDVVGRALPRIHPTASGEPADRFYGHVVIALDLAAQAQGRMDGQPLRDEEIFLGLRDVRGFAGDELHPARRAAGVAAAGVKLVDFGFVGQSVDEALCLGDVKGADNLNGELWQWLK
jgi:hypothetical protein